MKVIEYKKIDTSNHQSVTYIRVEPNDLSATVQNIIIEINNLSWISKFEDEWVQECFLERAEPTIKDITTKLHSMNTDSISKQAGEYIVSELSRRAIIDKMKYLNIPLSELYSKQKSGNPGFDFHAENETDNIVIFGEAKFLSRDNAYGKGLSSVVDFIQDKKDLKDLIDLRDFCSKLSLSKASKGKKGYAVGFSSKKTSCEKIIKGIIKNTDYKTLRKHEEIIMVAVNI